MGFSDLTVIDFDTIELHNITSQCYKASQIGMAKVDALAQVCKEFSEIDIKPINSADLYRPTPIIISCVDNMDLRLQLIDMCQSDQIVIEWRMSWVAFEIRTFETTAMNKKIYKEEQWFPQSEVEAPPCTEKSVAFNTFHISSIIWQLVRSIVTWYEYNWFISWDLLNELRFTSQPFS